MKAAVIANSTRGKCSPERFQATVDILQENDCEVVGTSFAANSIDVETLGKVQPDFAVVIGGDGTIISACHHFGDLQVPLMGVNLGKLGYLAHFTFEQFHTFIKRQHLQMLFSGRFISKRMLLDVQIGDKRFVAVNDLVADIGPPFRTTEVSLSVDGSRLPIIRGDGVIIATPTGSTAYNMSVGGSIIHPEVEGIAVTPKNPHRLSFRPLVVKGTSKILVQLPNPEGMYFIVDGQHVLDTTVWPSASVSRFHQDLQIVTRGDYWTTLTEKLHWGI